ncbi:MAG: hydrogenase formation protein HypD [Pseudanabaenaceae cyanobacterium]|jgi:hydrogenase expression/formation protein HypD
MKFVDEYRDRDLAQKYAQAIKDTVTQPWSIMEICGGQTHAIVKYGIDTLLPPEINLIHGPGCPVCVTDGAIIDRAIALALRPEVILCSFGDMLRVPGLRQIPDQPADLLSAKALGADVRTVYSPLDTLQIALDHPDQIVVFFGVGFETTAPATAMTVYQAAARQIHNFALLASHVLVPPAMELILGAPQCQVQGFLAAGHVCTVMGYGEYPPIASRYGVPIVVTGFEPVDVLQGIYLCVQQLEAGQAEVVNQYARSVRSEGNVTAQNLVQEVFGVTDQYWRGLGLIPRSGLGLRAKYQEFDVMQRFDLKPSDFHLKPETAKDQTNNQSDQTSDSASPEPVPGDCISGLILQGIAKPHSCPSFGKVCNPENPLGAPMVSSEGACAAYYRYRR